MKKIYNRTRYIYQIWEVWTLVSLFNFLLFFLFEFRVRGRVMSWSHCHKSVTSDDIVTSYEVTEKNIESSGKDDIV